MENVDSEQATGKRDALEVFGLTGDVLRHVVSATSGETRPSEGNPTRRHQRSRSALVADTDLRPHARRLSIGSGASAVARSAFPEGEASCDTEAPRVGDTEAPRVGDTEAPRVGDTEATED
jgi:hypothetical protein